jgi:hypothetical protein
MERVNVIKDICQNLGLQQIQNSWIKTLGDFLSIPELPGGDDYEQRVFTAAISNSNIVIPPATFITEDHGNLITTQTLGYLFTGDGVTLTSNPDDTVTIDIPGGVTTGLFGISDLGVYTYYNTLQDAVDAASGAQVIEVFGDYTEVMPVTITLKDGININGNGYTYRANDGTVNAFYGDAVNVKIYNYNITVTELKEYPTLFASAFLLENSSVIDFTGSEIYAVAETGQFEALAIRLFDSEIQNLRLIAVGDGTVGISTSETPSTRSVIRSCYVKAAADGLSGGAVVYDSVFDNGGTTQCYEIYNSTVKANSAALLATNIYNTSAYSVDGTGIICYEKAFNSVGYSVNNIGGVNTGSDVVYENCSFISENNIAFSGNTNTSFKNCNFTSEKNAVDGHAASVSDFGGTIIEFLNCTFEVANAGANCIFGDNAITIKYSNNSFKGATTPVHANITQGIINTSDSQGNIVPGGVSALPYRSLVGTITQVGTDDPTLVILQNDFNVTFTTTRISDGQYLIEGWTGIITNTDKIFIMMGNPFDSNQGNGIPEAPNTKYVMVYDIGGVRFQVNTTLDGNYTDDMLSRTPFEIRIYN